jgi:BirA family biotin operon repressor/biotin-[acetyl-CoA-carboxylase] ligase
MEKKEMDLEDFMDEKVIKSQLVTSFMGREIIYYEEVGSTNTEAKQIALDSREGTVVIADYQTRGTGRRGRSWDMHPKEAIAMSLILKPAILPQKASMLTLVMGLSVAKAIQLLYKTEVSIKWPNDIIINRKKVCGILTEMNAEKDSIQYVVIGTGINANIKSFSEELADIATSLRIELGVKICRAQLISSILEKFELYYSEFLKKEDLSSLMAEYNKLLIHRDRMIRILDPKGTYKACAKGINRDGELIIVTLDGQQLTIGSGEISIRGLESYIS